MRREPPTAPRVGAHARSRHGDPSGCGFASERGGWIKTPQIGSVRIGEDVEIGANTTVDCGAIDDTVIGQGVKIDDQVRVGHNVRIGARTGRALVVNDIIEPGVCASAVPVEKFADWRRILGRLKRIDTPARKVSSLQRRAGAGDLRHDEDDA